MNHSYLIRLILEQTNEETRLKSYLLNKNFHQTANLITKHCKFGSDINGEWVARDGECVARERKMITLQDNVFYYQFILDGACEGGHLDLFYFFMNKINNSSIWNIPIISNIYKWINLKFYYYHYYDTGMRAACRGNQLKVVELMIYYGSNAWNIGLFGACEGGHQIMAELMINKGATDFNWGLGAACYYNQPHLAKLMIDKGANRCPNCHNLSNH